MLQFHPLQGLINFFFSSGFPAKVLQKVQREVAPMLNLWVNDGA